MSTTAIDNFEMDFPTTSSAQTGGNGFRPSAGIIEDDVDITLSKIDGLIKRDRDLKLYVGIFK